MARAQLPRQPLFLLAELESARKLALHHDPYVEGDDEAALVADLPARPHATLDPRPVQTTQARQ